MAVYTFEALDARGKTQKGVLEADSPRQVRQKLRSDGLNAVAISPMAAQVGSDRACRPAL